MGFKNMEVNVNKFIFLGLIEIVFVIILVFCLGEFY